MEENSKRFLVVLTEIIRHFSPPMPQLNYLYKFMGTPEVSEYALNCLEVAFEAHWESITDLDKLAIEKLT